MLQSRTLPTSKPLRHIGIPEMRHFLYKCRSTAQLFSSDVADYTSYRTEPGNSNGLESGDNSKGNFMVKEKDTTIKMPIPGSTETMNAPEPNYLDNYRKICGQIHCSARPAKLIFRVNTESTVLAWVRNIYNFKFLDLKAN